VEGDAGPAGGAEEKYANSLLHKELEKRMSVDAEFLRDINLAWEEDHRAQQKKNASFGEHSAPFGEHLAPFGEHLAPFGEHMAPFGEHLAPFGEHLAPFGEHLAPFGEHVAPFGEHVAPRRIKDHDQEEEEDIIDDEGLSGLGR
jgi:hypothetical protein